MVATLDLPHPSKLLDQIRDKIRVKHYSTRTETQYLQWIKRFILFHGKRHPHETSETATVYEIKIIAIHQAITG